MATDIQAIDAHFAAEMSPDVSAEKIGSVYAEALFRAADNDLSRIREIICEFQEFIQNVLDVYPEFEALLSGCLVSSEEKLGILNRVFGQIASPLFLNFLRVVASHERLDCLRAIYLQVNRLYDVLGGRVRVKITTATTLTQEALNALTEDLRKKLPGELLISCEVDPNTIGGLIVRVGDTIYDGSIATQLDNLRRNIVKNYAPKQIIDRERS